VSSEPATTSSTVEVKWVEENLFVGSDGEGHSVLFDSSLSASPPKRGAKARGIEPMDALLTSLGACSGMDVAAILLKRRQRLTSLAVEVSGRRPRYGYPKPFTSIHLRYRIGGAGLEDGYVREAVADSMAKFCSVAATINAKSNVTFSYEIAQA
jgi:putative redox protein